MSHYYNEWDGFAANWLRELQKDGHIPAGEVDERSIVNVKPQEVQGYRQAHFFAGIGGWPLALKLAGWPEDEPVWTGSCPCQPFSVAGKARGVGDERHLWPAFHRLIAECHPAVVFGEQTESKDGRYWLAGVRDDLEREGYAVGAADLCAAGVGAPHRRQRLFWVADSELRRSKQRKSEERSVSKPDAGCGVDDSSDKRPSNGAPLQREHDRKVATDGCEFGGMGISDSGRRLSRIIAPPSVGHWSPVVPTNFWSDSRSIKCRDGKSRRIPFEPSLFPLAPRVPGRVGLLRGAGGSIVPQVAAEFIKAYLEVTE